MATISDSIRLNDGFTPILKNMQQAVNLTINGFERLQKTTDNTMNLREFELAKIKINDIGAEIRQAEQEQKKFDSQLKNSNNSANKLLNTIKGFVSAYALYQSGKEFISAADDYANIQARLNLINDGLQTTEELNQKIFDSAGRARGNYTEMADVVGKLGITASKAFSSNDEMIQFSELMTKSFKIAGASAQEQSSAMYQLTQAMASGRLQGDEFRSILENAPMLAQSIADELGVSIGALKDMSSEGLITSDVIKSALFNSAGKINEQFEQMPIKFGEVVTSIKNNLFKSLQPAFQRFSDFINSDRGQEFFTKLGNGIIFAANIASKFMDIILWVAMIFTDYWSLIAPILFMILTPLALLKAATIGFSTVMVIHNALTTAGAFLTSSLARKKSMLTGATAQATVAQWGFNAALLASPLMWAVLIISVIIGAIWLLIKVLNLFGISTGQIVGAVIGFLFALWAFIQNMFIDLYNNLIGPFANFLKNVFKDPVGAIKMLFLDLMTNVINFIYKIAEALEGLINKIPGFEVDITSGLENTLSKIESAKKAIEDETGVTSFEPMEFKSITQAYGNGAEWGSNAWDSFSKKFDKDNYMNQMFPDTKSSIDGLNMDSINYIGEIGSINDTVDISSEDLKIMRELSERKAIENYVTLTPTIDVKTGDIKNGADIDELVAKIEDMLETDIAASTKAVYDLG
ncbi:MAG: tape measure protein [Vulcanibacillus sp.]